EKQKKDGETQPSYYFCAYHGFGNPFSCITAVKRVANDVENPSGKAKRCHSGRLVACSYGKIFQPADRDPGWKNRDLGKRARPPSHMNTSKILQRI
ncbi:unnamed protein product, partial [Pocillopora meandrina]